MRGEEAICSRRRCSRSDYSLYLVARVGSYHALRLDTCTEHYTVTRNRVIDRMAIAQMHPGSVWQCRRFRHFQLTQQCGATSCRPSNSFRLFVSWAVASSVEQLYTCDSLQPTTSSINSLTNKMADPTAFYEPEEDELLSSLAVPTYQTSNNGEDEYRRMQELERHAYEQQASGNDRDDAEQSQLLEMVPEDVKRVSDSLIRIVPLRYFGALRFEVEDGYLRPATGVGFDCWITQVTSTRGNQQPFSHSYADLR